MLRQLIARSLLIAGVITILLPTLTLAQNVQVTGTVPPNVDATLSTVATDLVELPADGVSSVLVTVTAKNHDGTPATNLSASITSNRGSVDVFGVYTGNTLADGFSGTTDSNGLIKFTVRSSAPGQATFTVIVDTITLDNKPTVTFTPLPILSNLSLTVQLPGGKKLTIIQPSTPQATTEHPSTQPATQKLVNTQVELNVSFWAFLLLILLLLASPILLLLLAILILRLRRLMLFGKDRDKKEEELLAKIYALEQQLAQGQQTNLAQAQQLSAQIKQTDQDVKQSTQS